MATFSVAESGQEGARSLTIEYVFGANLDEAVEKFGKEVVYAGFVADGKVSVQGVARRLLKTNKEDNTPYTDEEIQARVSEYVMGSKAERGTSDPFAKIEKVVGKLSEAQKAEFLAKLQALL